MGIQHSVRAAQRVHQVHPLESRVSAAVQRLQTDHFDESRALPAQQGIAFGVGLLVFDRDHGAQGATLARQCQRIGADAHGDVLHMSHLLRAPDIVDSQQPATGVVLVIVHANGDHRESPVRGYGHGGRLSDAMQAHVDPVFQRWSVGLADVHDTHTARVCAGEQKGHAVRRGGHDLGHAVDRQVGGEAERRCTASRWRSVCQQRQGQQGSGRQACKGPGRNTHHQCSSHDRSKKGPPRRALDRWSGDQVPITPPSFLVMTMVAERGRFPLP